MSLGVLAQAQRRERGPIRRGREGGELRGGAIRRRRQRCPEEDAGGGQATSDGRLAKVCQMEFSLKMFQKIETVKKIVQCAWNLKKYPVENTVYIS